MFANYFFGFTWTLARTTSMGLVMVEAVAAAIGPAKACSIRWGHSLGANRDSCSVVWRKLFKNIYIIRVNEMEQAMCFHDSPA